MSDVRVESMVLSCCQSHYFWAIRIPLGKRGGWEGGRGEKRILQLSTTVCHQPSPLKTWLLLFHKAL